MAAQDGHPMAPNQTQFTLSRRIAPVHEADIDAEPLKLRASNIEVAAPGARGTQMLKAPLADVPETKRAPMIIEQDTSLVETTVELEEGTIRRNRELHEKLSAIEQRGVHWEAKLRAEVDERKKRHEELVEHFKNHLDEACKKEEEKLMEMIERFHAHIFPEQEQRMADEEEEVRVFVHETVPTVIDRQSGIIGRKLQKAHDTFDIENAKIMKREQKIIQRFERHVARTAQSFEDERATRRGKFMLLEEDIDDVERIDDRLEEKQVTALFDEVETILDTLQKECRKREKEDNSLLDAMLYSQAKLQHSVLESFGADADDKA